MAHSRGWLSFVAFLVHITLIIHASASSYPQATCETTLIALKKGALELETRLKKCKQDEKQGCDQRTASVHADLEREKDVSQRLRELLSAKDLEKSVSIKDLETSYKEQVELLKNEMEEVKADLEEQRKDATQAKQFRDELADEKKKSAALAYSLNECKENFEKKTTDEVAALKEKIDKQSSKLDSYKETLDARDAEIETLRRIVAKLEEQKRAGFLEWLNNPNSIESLFDARNRTLELLVPGLGATERRLLELRAMSSAKIESLIGDHDTSILMSGLLAWGILLIPFFLSFCLLVRVRLSLSKMVLWASLYAALFCIVMYGFSYGMGKEALGSLRRLSILSHDIMLILIMVGHVLQIMSIYLLTLKQWLVNDLGSLRARHMLQFAIPVLVAGHYYYYYYFSAISSVEEDTKEDVELEEDEFDARFWLIYAVAYFFLCILVVLGTSSTSSGSSSSVTHSSTAATKPSPAVEAAANVVTTLVHAVEGNHDSQSEGSRGTTNLTVDTDIEAGSGNTSPTVASEKVQKKKKKKTKESSLEFLGPDDVLDAVVSATRHHKSDEKGD